MRDLPDTAAVSGSFAFVARKASATPAADVTHVKNSSTHVACLDTIRAVAILAVSLFHCLYPAFLRDRLEWSGMFKDFSGSLAFLALFPLSYGWTGVAAFFVVSGFCVHLSYRRGTPGDWYGFFVRRAFRICPSYLVALILFAVVFPATRLAFQTELDWAQFGSHRFLVHNLDERFCFGVVSAFWSIATEAQLYLVYPALVVLAGKVGWRRTLWLLGLVEFSLRLCAGLSDVFLHRELPYWLAFSPLFYGYSWALGARLAESFMRGERLPLRSSSVSLWLFLALATFLIRPLAPFSFPLFSILTATVITKLLTRQTASRAPSVPKREGFMRALGVSSYSFYLLHQPLLVTLPLVLRKGLVAEDEPLAMFAFCLSMYPMVFAVTALCYRFCELPSIALGKALLRRRLPGH
jgi:peptidoglycan/LPS O-acetylase OafA/YrhL